MKRKQLVGIFLVQIASLVTQLNAEGQQLTQDGIEPMQQYECKIDLSTGSDCYGFVQVLEHNPLQRQALLQLDVTNFDEAIITVTYWGAEGWITNLGSSRTNNGGGGDNATNSFDSEIDLRGQNGQCNLSAYTNDYYSPNNGTVYSLFEPAAETNILTYVFMDGNIDIYKGYYLTPSIDDIGDQPGINELISSFRGEGFFQFDGWDEEAQAYNDRQFFIGLNRVIDGTYRSGTGAAAARIILRTR